MLDIPDSWDNCQGKLLIGSGTSSGLRHVLKSIRLKEVGVLNSALTSNMEMQRLKFV